MWLYIDYYLYGGNKYFYDNTLLSFFGDVKLVSQMKMPNQELQIKARQGHRLWNAERVFLDSFFNHYHKIRKIDFDGIMATTTYGIPSYLLSDGVKPVIVYTHHPLTAEKSNYGDKPLIEATASLLKRGKIPVGVQTIHKEKLYAEQGFNTVLLPITVWCDYPPPPKSFNERKYDVIIFTRTAHTSKNLLKRIANQLRDFNIVTKDYGKRTKIENIGKNVTIFRRFLPRPSLVSLLNDAKVYLHISESLEEFGVRTYEGAAFSPVVYISDVDICPWIGEWAINTTFDNLNETINSLLENEDYWYKQLKKCREESLKYTQDKVLDIWRKNFPFDITPVKKKSLVSPLG